MSGLKVSGEVPGEVAGATSEQAATGEVTLLLDHLRGGDRQAFDRLFPLVYRELRRIAARRLGGRRATPTLAPTALVHEAYLKMVDQRGVPWQNRAHFFAVAARAMRQILIDQARRRQAAKRGGEHEPITLTQNVLGPDLPLADLLALDQALDRLETLDARLRQVVELRFFGGLQENEVAEVLGITTRTVQRDWTRARAWLYRELYDSKSEGGG